MLHTGGSAQECTLVDDGSTPTSANEAARRAFVRRAINVVLQTFARLMNASAFDED